MLNSKELPRVKDIVKGMKQTDLVFIFDHGWGVADTYEFKGNVLSITGKYLHEKVKRTLYNEALRATVITLADPIDRRGYL